MKRWLTVLVCGVALSTVAARCGGSSSSEEETSAPAAVDEDAGFSEDTFSEPASGTEEGIPPSDDDTFADPIDESPSDMGMGEDPIEEEPFGDDEPLGEPTGDDY